MPDVELPDGRVVEFPDNMSNDDISSAIQINFPEFAQQEQPGQQPEQPEQQIEQPVNNVQPTREEMLVQNYLAGKLNGKPLEAAEELIRRGVVKVPDTWGGGQNSGATLEQGYASDTRGIKAGIRKALPYARPVIEAAPAIAAGMAAAPFGGPFAPAAAAAGGAAGYAAGKTITDRLESWAQPEGTTPEQMPVIEELGVLGDDLIRGLTFELGGASVPAAFNAILKAPGFVKSQIAQRFPAMSEKEIAKRADDIIKANTGTSPQYLKNIEESQAVVDEIKGFQATKGEMSGDPGQIMLQRGLELPSGGGSPAQVIKKAENLEAIEGYLKKNFPGDEGIDNVLEELTRQKTALQETTKATSRAAETQAGKVVPEAPQQTGEKIMQEIEAAREPVRKIEKEYWDKVPDYEMKVTETENAFKKLKATPSQAAGTVEAHFATFDEMPKTVEGMHVIEQELNDVIFSPTATNTEKRAMGKIKTALTEDFRMLGEAAEQGDFATFEGKVVHPKQLQKELADIDTKLAAETKMSPDKIDVGKMQQEMKKAKIPGIMQQVAEDSESFAERLAKQYERNFKKQPPVIKGKESPQFEKYRTMKEGIEQKLAGSEEAKNAAIAYKNAKAYSASQNFDRFGKGVVEELRRSGKYEGGKKIPAEQRPKKLMSVGSADQFIKAVGKDKAGDIMIRHYADDMMSNPAMFDDAGQIKSKVLSNWVKKNARVLDRYGIKNFFDDTDSAYKAMEAAKQAENKFNKSIAEKMLDSDPQNAISRALTGGEGISAKNTGKIMQTLVNQVKGNPKALNGLKNGFQEFMIDIIKTTEKSAKGDAVLAKAALTKAIKRYRPAMEVLYKGQPGKIKALDTVQKALEIQNRTAKGVGGGPDTAEKLNAVSNILGTIIERIPGISYTAKLLKLGLGSFKNLNIKETNDMVVRMLHDPELANIIIRAAKKNPNTKKISSDLSRYMLTTGMRETGKTMEEKNE